MQMFWDQEHQAWGSRFRFADFQMHVVDGHREWCILKLSCDLNVKIVTSTVVCWEVQWLLLFSSLHTTCAGFKTSIHIASCPLADYRQAGLLPADVVACGPTSLSPTFVGPAVPALKGLCAFVQIFSYQDGP